MVQLPSGTITFKEYIAKEREIINPNFKPIFAAVSHVTYSVMVSPPTTHHRDVASMVSSPLSYVLPSKRPVPINILDDVSFYLRPGEMTLLLGAPGAHTHEFFVKQTHQEGTNCYVNVNRVWQKLPLEAVGQPFTSRQSGRISYVQWPTSSEKALPSQCGLHPAGRYPHS